jgi:hypothetical protein
MERAIEVQEVILRAIAKKITWWQEAEIIGISDWHTRRWRERYEEFAFRGCLTGVAASLPPSPDICICQEQYVVVGYENFLRRKTYVRNETLFYVTTETR